MHSSVAYDKSKKEVLQFEVPQQPAFRQADVIASASCHKSSSSLLMSVTIVAELSDLEKVKESKSSQI